MFRQARWILCIAMVLPRVAQAEDYSALRVTEIMYHAPDSGVILGDTLDFLEFKNAGDIPIDISGIRVVAIQFTAPPNSIIPPGEFFIAVKNKVNFQQKYPTVSAAVAEYLGGLSNSGEALIVSTPAPESATIFSVFYSELPPWPATADGVGFSLVPINPNVNPDPNDPANWRASSEIGGSPGMDDPTPTSIPPLIISELLTHTDPPMRDTVEIYNPTPDPYDMGGWFITNNPAKPKKYRVPNGTIIPGNGYLIFDDEDFQTNNQPEENKYRLDKYGGEVWLYSGDEFGNLTGYSFVAEYEDCFNGVAMGRTVSSTGEVTYPMLTARTHGLDNSEPRVGPLVITEIMYAPPGGGDEYIEIMNISGAPVPLFRIDTGPDGDLSSEWRLEGVSFEFPTGLTIPAHGVMLIVDIDPETFRAKYSIAPEIPIYRWTGALQDAGEVVDLMVPDQPDFLPEGTIVPYMVADRIHYRDSSPWPAARGLTSIERRDLFSYGNEALNWRLGTGPTGTPGFVPLVPTAAANVLAIGKSDTEIDVSWNDVAGNETGYLIERSPDGVSNWGFIASVSANAQTFTDSGLASGVSYFYRVRSFNDVGPSARSNVAEGTTSSSSPVLPAAPTGLVAAAASSTVIQLAWTDNSATETGFRVERSLNGADSWTNVGDTLRNARTFPATGLLPQHVYYFRVCAFNGPVSSAFTNIAFATTPGSADDFDGDGILNVDEIAIGTNPRDFDSKPGGTADFDGDGLKDHEDPDSDGDGVSNADERAANTDQYNASSFPKTALTVTSLKGVVKYNVNNGDGCTIVAVIPSAAADVQFAGKTVSVNVGGVVKAFTLDDRGKNSTKTESLAMIYKKARGKPGAQVSAGTIQIKISLKKGNFGNEWSDDGLDRHPKTETIGISMPVNVHFDGKVYSVLVPCLYKAVALKGGSFKKSSQ